MPVLYKSNLNNNMKTWKEATIEDLREMARLRECAKNGYTNNDLASLTNMVRLFVNRNAPACLTCHNAVAENKNELNSFYLEYKDKIKQNLEEQMLNTAIKFDEVELANKQVIEYKEDGEKSKRGRKPKNQ